MPIYRIGKRIPRSAASAAYIAPDASIIGTVEFGRDASVWFRTVIRGDSERIVIGECTNVQDGCVLHADPGDPLILGANVTIGHQVMLHGCRVGEASMIGMSSILLNGSKVGAGSILGAGSLLAEGKEIPDGVLALGAPARVVRKLTPEEQRSVLEIAEHYVERARQYRSELVSVEPD